MKLLRRYAQWLLLNIFWVILAYSFLCGGLGFWVGRASAHDGYEDWRMPDAPSVSCCNNADCRPTRAFTDEDGNWHAWNGHTWLLVPKNKLLPMDYKHDGRSHLCESNGAVYCFSPTEPKS